MPVIRGYSQKLSTAQPSMAQLIGPLLLWAMVSISKRREQLAGPSGTDYAGFETATIAQMRDELAQIARTLMIFTGLVKLRMQNSYWDAITRAAAENGVY